MVFFPRAARGGVKSTRKRREAALLELPELTPNYQIVVTRSGTLDEAEVEVEVSESLAAEHAPELRERAERHLRERIGCSFTVTLQAPGSVPRSEGGKLRRVLDRRTFE